ncbi:MAG: chorismate mutase [Tannerella sp.]|jgi:isochorismate pyruvate lyase|nr:chorismate mutase [Tannerella sp.]
MECENLEEVRHNIDRIDGEIIQLIAERGAYVRQAARFKKDGEDVKAPQRVEAVVQKTRLLAAQHGANPDMIEKLYRDMIEGFIRLEMNAFQENG